MKQRVSNLASKSFKTATVKEGWNIPTNIMGTGTVCVCRQSCYENTLRNSNPPLRFHLHFTPAQLYYPGPPLLNSVRKRCWS